MPCTILKLLPHETLNDPTEIALAMWNLKIIHIQSCSAQINIYKRPKWQTTIPEKKCITVQGNSSQQDRK